MARDLTFPPSVKAGIPKLGPKPDGWREVAFGDILEVVSRPAQLEPKQRYQLLTAKRNRGGIVPRSILRGDQIKTRTQFYVASGDFVISRRQIVHGACGIVPPHLDGAVVSNEYDVFTANDGLFMPYLGYYTHSIHFQQTCFNSSVGVAIEKMVFDLNHWLKHRVHLPPAEEQRRIVSVLTTVDRAMERTGRLIEARRKLKKGLAQQLLTGERRLPGFGDPAIEGKTGKESKCGWVPADWECVHLRDVARLNPITLPESTPPGYSFWYIDLSMVKQGVAEFPAEQIRFEDAPSRARRVVSKGDITMSTVRPNLRGYAFWPDEVQDVVCSTGFAVIRVTNASAEFIYQWLYSTQVARYFYGCIAGTGYPALNPGDVENIAVPCPPLKEQNRIAAVLGAADRGIVLLQKKLAALAKLKHGLMQKLLSSTIQDAGASRKDEHVEATP